MQRQKTLSILIENLHIKCLQVTDMAETDRATDSQLARALEALEVTEKQLKDAKLEIQMLKKSHKEAEQRRMEELLAVRKELERKIVKLEETNKEVCVCVYVCGLILATTKIQFLWYKCTPSTLCRFGFP